METTKDQLTEKPCLRVGAVSGRLTEMQSFFLNLINQHEKQLNPCYMANLYYESIGKRRHVASRDSFGQTSAAYRTCRALSKAGLIQEHQYKTDGGYSYTMYSACR